MDITRVRKIYDNDTDDYIDDIKQYKGYFADNNNARIFAGNPDIQPEDVLSVSEHSWFKVTEVRDCKNHTHVIGRKDER